MGRTAVDLLERSAQLAELHRCVGAAARGEGCVVFVGGEAGIGKSSLVRRMSAEVGSLARVLVGACDWLTTPQPLGPLLDVAAALDDQLERLLVGGAPGISVFRRVLAALAGSAKPTVLVIEDAHWADEATLDLVRFLARRIGPLRSMLLITYRDDEVDQSHPLRVVLGDLATSPSVHRLALPPLSEEAVRCLAAANPERARIDWSRIYRETGGNPFFVTEVLAVGAAELPATVRDAVLARAVRLSLGARTVLDAAAVIGRRIDLPLLAEAALLDAASTAAGIDECLARGLFGLDGTKVEFRHELTREAIVQALPPVRRAALHERVLAGLQALPVEQQDPARLAHHAEAAGNGRAVLVHAPEAARIAAALGAHREAASQYDRAIRWAGAMPSDRRAGLLEVSAYEHYLTGEVERAIAQWQEAIDLRRATGDRLRSGENLRYLSRACWIAGRRGEAAATAREAIAILEELPPGRELAMAYSARSQLFMLDEETTEAIAWGRRGIALAERLGDAETLVHALNNVGFSRVVAGDEGGFAELRRSLRLALDHGFVEHAARAHMNLVAGLVRRYELDRAEEQLASGLAFCGDNELHVYTVSLLSFRLLARFHRGYWVEAAEEAASVLAQPPETLYTSARPNSLLVLGRLRARRGESGARSLLDEALDAAERSGESGRIGAIRIARTEAAWLAGEYERAIVEARSGLEMAIRTAEPWLQGELEVWLRRLGGTESVASSALPEPFARAVDGDWQGAARWWEARGCPFEGAIAQMDAGEETPIRQALAVFDGLGARAAAAVAARELRRIGARSIPRGARPATRAHPAGLTGREIEVLSLVAQGLRDAEIADRLFISPSTTGKHVSAILAKLGAASRTEAVQIGVRLGLVRHVDQSSESSPPR